VPSSAAETLNAFKTVTSITGAGWVINVAADTITVGTSESLGLPDDVAADLANIIAVLGVALIAAIAGEDVATKIANGGKK